MQRIILSLLVLFICMGTAYSQAPSRAELEKQRADIQREIEEVRQALDQTKKNKKESLSQLLLLQRKLKLRQAAIGNINEQINSIQGNINLSRNEIG